MAGETALARQLKKLAVPQTSILIQDKIRKSLLFDHRDAAGLDREVVFACGTTGLQKLCTINPLFTKFKSNLFSVSYKDFQRSVQTASVNEKLDAKISEFLRLLSPYFLIRYAHEALEWLIYRFHIHLYNVDELIASAIPHHNTSTFVRVVQLLDLDEKSRWLWLKPIQKTGVHLEYSALLNRFIADSGFRKFVCDIALNVVSVYKDDQSVAVPIISFCMSTICNALNRCEEIDDKFVVFLFPYILKGLSTDLKKYTLASYMVISKMILSVKLSPDIIKKILIKIFETLKDDLVQEACKILLLAFQYQTVKSLPKQVFFVIFSKSHCKKSLFCSINDAKVFALIRAIFKNTVFMFSSSSLKTKKDNKALKFLKKFFNCVQLDEKCVTMCFNITVKKIVMCTKNKKTKKNLQLLKKIAKCVFQNLERKYPEQFDKAYQMYLEKKCKHNKSMICNLISKSVCSKKYNAVPNMETSLALGLNHANPQIRQTSVSYLIQLLTNKKLTDMKFVTDSLYDCLCDSNPNVVLEVLSSLDLVLQILDKSKLLSAFEHIFSRQIKLKSEWYDVQMRCLNVVTTLFNDDSQYDILDLMLSFLFPVNEDTIAGFLHLLNSDLKNNCIQVLHVLNTDISKNDVTSDELFQINCMVVRALRKVIIYMSEEAKLSYCIYLRSKVTNLKSNSVLVFYVYAMQFLLETSKNVSNSLFFINDILQVMKSYFSNDEAVLKQFEVMSEESVIRKSIKCLNKGYFPTCLLYNAFYNIITCLDLEIKCKSWPSIGGSYGDSYEIISNMFDFCIMNMNAQFPYLCNYLNRMLSVLISHQLKNIQTTFWFLATKLLNYSKYKYAQIAVANISVAFCERYKMDWVFNNPMIFFSIVKAVANPASGLRNIALRLLRLCVNSENGCTDGLKLLGNEIVMKLEEIKVDYKQCFDCIGSWLKVAVEFKDSKKSRAGKELNDKISVLSLILNLLNEQEVPYSVKHFLLSCLQNIDSSFILASYIPVLYNHINLFETSTSDKESILNVIHLLIKKFTPKTAVFLTDISEESKSLLHCLNFTIGKENDIDRSVQELSLDVLSKEFFSAIPSNKIQLEIFENLVILYLTSPLKINNKVETVLRQLCPYSYLFIKHLQEKELSTSKSTTLREVKKSKKENSLDNTFESGTWKKITVMLELMQSESDLLKKEVLIPELFNLLHKSINYDTEPSVEYIKQLILSAIHNCYEQLSCTPQQKLECDFRVEVITLCIRTSTNSKTHHQALLLLNLGAKIYPDCVLDNIMSIFVFMGSNLVRQDDSYSFQVLSQIIETIMPSLLEASNQQTKTDGYQVVASVIRVFVDSLLDIPGHRQLPLFTKIITTLGSSKYLWIPLGQICDQYATAFHDITTDDSNNWKISPTLEFAVSLHQEFSPDIQIDTCINLVKFLQMLPDTKKQLETDSDVFKKIKEPFDVVAHTDKQLQIYKQNVLCYMKIWLSSQAFRYQVAELSTKQQNNLEEKYEQLLEYVLGFLQDRLNTKKSSNNEMKINDQVQLLYDLVHAINSLLPCNLFIQVMKQLLKNKGEIQLRAIELLNTKLEQHKEVLYSANHKSLLKLRKPLLNLVETHLNKEDKNDENVVIQQTVLYSLHLLCKLLGSEYPTKFYKVLRISVAILTKYDKPELIINALLCIGQLCYCLNVDILPHLNSFMPAIINILRDNDILNLNECLILGIITTLNSIVENLGIFLSSYMEDIIINICLHSVNYSELGKKSVSEKFATLQTKLAKEIPLRVLFNAIANSYTKLSHKNAHSVVPLMKILTQNVDATKYEDVLACATELQNVYLSLLDFRNSNQLLPVETVNLIESSIISSLQTFVMKLSVTRFRTFFQKIYQWAVVSSDDQEQKFRIFTFYKMTSEFSKSLKSLFSVMSKYFFTHVSQVLDSNNKLKSKVGYFDSNETLSHELLINVLDTLNYCFMYAEEQLLDKENFDLLMQPLVDQIENLHDDMIYQDLIEHHLSNCIAHFMAAVSDDKLWKSLNYQVLLKTRHDSPKVRFGALQVILQVVNKMGDNYRVLLPESLPFLYEVMEDESSEVEQECQTVIMEMEKILGEPIRQYF